MVVRHPLQPFAPAAFGGDSEPRRFSYHAQWWPAAAQPAQTRVALPAWFGDAALAPVDDETGATLSLDELRRFLQAPAEVDRKSTRLNSSHYCASRMPSSA